MKRIPESFAGQGLNSFTAISNESLLPHHSVPAITLQVQVQEPGRRELCRKKAIRPHWTTSPMASTNRMALTRLLRSPRTMPADRASFNPSPTGGSRDGITGSNPRTNCEQRHAHARSLRHKSLLFLPFRVEKKTLSSLALSLPCLACPEAGRRMLRIRAIGGTWKGGEKSGATPVLSSGCRFFSTCPLSRPKMKEDTLSRFSRPRRISRAERANTAGAAEDR
jgi:hypothetical protein